MKILLIATNKIRTPRPSLPIGMSILCSALKNLGHTIDTLDLCWVTTDQIAVIDKIRKFSPEVIGLSIRNIDNLTFLDPQFFGFQINRIVQCCRKYSNAKIILGGTGFSVVHQQLFDFVKPDYGIRGEGEIALPCLIDYFSGKKEIYEVPGLCYLNKNNYTTNIMECGFDFSNPILPDRSVYNPKYFVQNISLLTESKDVQPAIETIQSKRGCGLDCSYCSIRKTEGKISRLKPPKLIVEEIKEIIKNNPNIEEIEFVDASFNHPLEHALDVCKELIEAKTNIKWFCQLAINFITDELISLLKKSGCHRVELGTDGLNDETLQYLNKGFTIEKVYEVDRMLHNSNINFTHCVFFGGPGDYGKNFEESIKNISNFKANQVYANLGIRVFENTKLFDIGIQKKIVSYERNNLLPTFFIEPELLNNRKHLDILTQKTASSDNWYLWWGIKKQSLSERIEFVKNTLEQIDATYCYEYERNIVSN